MDGALRALFVAFAVLASAHALEAQDAPRRRALVIGVDGLTGPALQRYAFAEGSDGALRSLMNAGIYASCDSADDERCARAHDGPAAGEDYRYETASGWVSVVTGMNNAGHGVRGNAFDEQTAFVRTSRHYPTFFHSLKRHGFRTAAGGVANFLTSKDGDAIDSGVVDFECGVEGGALRVAWNAVGSCNLDWRRADDLDSPLRDDALLDWTVERIDDGGADLVMSVFDEVDSAGHSNGFEDSAGYRAAIAEVDLQIARLLDLVRGRARDDGEAWLVTLTSDHGGHDVLFGLYGMHRDTLPDDSAVPFIVATFGADEPLTALVAPVRHMDVHPTVMRWFRARTNQTDGQPQGIPGLRP